jgi:hypothetical protein
MSFILGEWREDKVRPLQGNAPHDRLVSRGISCSLWSICDDLFPATRFPQRLIPGARYAFSRHGGIYRSDVAGPQTSPEPNQPPPAGRPVLQAKKRAGRITFFSSSAMSSGRLFLDRVGRHQSPSPLDRRPQNITHLVEHSGKGDISTLLATGHFYFALTILSPGLQMKHTML